MQCVIQFAEMPVSLEELLTAVEELKTSGDDMAREIKELELMMTSRDEEMKNADRRAEELAAKLKKVEDIMQDKLTGTVNQDDGGWQGGRSAQKRSIPGNPAFRSLEAYTGEHASTRGSGPRCGAS